MRWLLVCLVLGGCAYTEEKFTEEYSAEVCRINGPDCLKFFDTVEDCLDADDADDPCDGATFDAKKAKECVDAWQNLVCPGSAEDLVLPSVCDEVYTCPGGDDSAG